jgi:hypothetical protein
MSLYPNGNKDPTAGTAATDANMIGGANLDGGSCCGVTTNALLVITGYIGLVGVPDTSAN